MMNTRRIVTGVVMMALFAGVPHEIGAVQGSGEQIGEVLGTAVYREQIQEADGQPLTSELFRLFFHPLLTEYYRAHQPELQPTPQEIESVTAVLARRHQEAMAARGDEIRAQLDDVGRRLARADLSEDERLESESEREMLTGQLQPPGPQYVEWLVGNWKFQRHLYLNYGGGRILWQQSGLEAFDAAYQWLRQQEQAGALAITDAHMHTAFFAYWTTLEHGAFLIDDQAVIEQEFLSPEWAQGIVNR